MIALIIIVLIVKHCTAFIQKNIMKYVSQTYKPITLSDIQIQSINKHLMLTTETNPLMNNLQYEDTIMFSPYILTVAEIATPPVSRKTFQTYFPKTLLKTNRGKDFQTYFQDPGERWSQDTHPNGLSHDDEWYQQVENHLDDSPEGHWVTVYGEWNPKFTVPSHYYGTTRIMHLFNRINGETSDNYYVLTMKQPMLKAISPPLIERQDVKKKAPPCYQCGLNETGIPTTPGCYHIFEGDTQFSYLRPNHKVKCHLTYATENTGRKAISGCFKRFLDIGLVYNERGCREMPPVKGKSYASARLRSMERILHTVDEGCAVSPHASLTPFSRTVSLYAYYHVCVCNSDYCNHGYRKQSSSVVSISILVCFII